jgi:hypothetical protein
MEQSLVEKAARALRMAWSLRAKGLEPEGQGSGQRTCLVSAAPGRQAATHQRAPVTPEGFWRNRNALCCGQLRRSVGG